MAMGVPGGVNPLDFLHKLSMQRGLSAPVFKQVKINQKFIKVVT